jgi:hypothetical protein
MLIVSTGQLLPFLLTCLLLAADGGVPAGGIVTRLLRIPELRVLLQDACGFNMLQPANLLGNITFKYSITDSSGKVVWEVGCAGADCGVCDAERAVMLPGQNVTLPSTGIHLHVRSVDV